MSHIHGAKEPFVAKEMFHSFSILLVFCFGITITFSQSIIKSLPGFNGNLPFDLETGYVAIDEYNDAQFFYSFVKSERNPREDPLLLWFDGGPGCSTFCGFAFEIGPVRFVNEEYNGSLPKLMLNPYSWTKVSNVIFLDTPVGTGFSYSKTLNGAFCSDTIFTNQIYVFLRKWLIAHPDFLHNPLYISSLSYSGLVVPVAAQVISDGNEAGRKPFVNLKGYVIGSPVIDRHIELNSQVRFAHGMGLISHELYESAKKNCHEEYQDVDPRNILCIKDIQAIKELTLGINTYHISEPLCLTELIEPDVMRKEGYLIQNPADMPLENVCLKEDSSEISLSPSLPADPVNSCRTYGYKLLYYWANNYSVQEALRVRKGTIEEWVRCNLEIPYEKQLRSSLSYQRNLNTKGYRTLLYNGDNDMMVPYVGTQEWIRSLNFSIVDDWRPWYVEGQVAGYTRAYSNNLTYATVKGGGHEVPMYKHKESLEMYRRWISHSSI